MKDWQEVRLGAVCSKIGSGATPRGGKEVYKSTGISLIRSQNVLDFVFSADGLAYIDNTQAERLSNVCVEEDDVLLNITGDSVARACLAPLQYVPARVNQHVAIIRGKPQVISNKYMLYYLQFIKSFLLSISASGGTRNALTKAMIENIEIPLPPFPMQKRIAAILSALDDKIELNNRMNRNLEAQAQAIFKSWFVDFEQWGGVMPKDWTEGTLGEMLLPTISGDWGKDTEQPNFSERVICIRGADLPEIEKGNKGNAPTRFISKKNLALKKLCANEIIIEISGGSPTQSTGRCAFISKELISSYEVPILCTNFCRALKPIEIEYAPFIYLLLKYLYKCDVFFQYENGTTGIKNLDLSGFLATEKINIPAINTVKSFKTIFDMFFRLICQNSRQSQTLAALRGTLLPKLMNGEIDLT